MAEEASKPEEKKRARFSRKDVSEIMRIYSYILPYRWYFILGLVLLVLSSLVFMVFPVAAGEMANIANGEPKYGLSLKQIGVILFVILIIQSVVSYIRVLLFAYVSEKGMADVRKALYRKLVSLPIPYYEQHRVGELTSRITTDVAKLQNAISITSAEFIRQVVILVVGILYIAFMTPRLGLFMLATFPVIVISAMIFGRFIRKLSKQRQDELAQTNVIVEETLQTINTVKAYTSELFESFRYGKSVDNVVVTSLKYAKYRGLFISFIILVLFGAIFFILWQGSMLVAKGLMEVGDLFSFIMITIFIGGAISSLGNFYTQLIGAAGATERIREILDQDTEVDLENQDLEGARIEGNIQYEDVHFSYPTRQDIEVLKGIDLNISAGKKIALVGGSGAGKSTIIQLLLRFYELDKGNILVDGKNITDYNISHFRRNLAIVPQEVLLFGGSILENIAYGKQDASEEEIIEAAKKANAWNFINDFPEGLETVVGERGIKLSGGQRQRIAIARAILKDPAILILDEATSSLDAESERLVQDALNKLMEGRTSIIIAHRLATIREVDCIYVIDEGKIIEAGTHDELAIIENGIYAGLAKLQFDLS